VNATARLMERPPSPVYGLQGEAWQKRLIVINEQIEKRKAAAREKNKPLYPWKNPDWPQIKKKKKGSKHWPKLTKMLKERGSEGYKNLSAPPSLLPAKKYCDITGLAAPYTDPQTKLNYAAADIFYYIRQNLNTQAVQEHLDVRKAGSLLK